MTTATPVITLNNGVTMPLLGLGVYLTPPDQAAAAVAAAVACGYRLIDTAAAYNNERQVGEGIRRSGIDRSAIFLTTKLWIADYGYDSALRAFEASLRRLGVDYVDLYLLHWPVPMRFDDTVAAYRAAIRLLEEGRVRAIGVSNFGPRHLEELIARTGVVPAVNQVELHPFFAQVELRRFHDRLGIVTQAWSPIGGVLRRRGEGGGGDVLDHPVVAGLARKYGKTPAQVVLRWHLEHGIAAIPKSVRPERIRENIDIFDFRLAPEEVAAIDALDRGVRAGRDPETADAADFSIRVEDD